MATECCQQTIGTEAGLIVRETLRATPSHLTKHWLGEFTFR